LKVALEMGPRKGPSPTPEPKTAWPVLSISVKDIDPDALKRLRPLRDDAVKEKMKSITEIGLLNPITVRIHPAKPTIGNPPRPRYQLCAGLHPQTTKGKAQGEGKKRSLALKNGTDRQIGGEIPEDEAPTKPSSFVESTAAVSGQSTRSVERDVDRTKIADDVLETAIKEGVDSGQALDGLKNLPHEEQRERVKAMLAAPAKSKGKPVAVSSTLTPEEKTARDERNFNAAWKYPFKVFEEATAQARKNIVAKLATDLNAEIHFAGETMKPAPVSLTNREPATVH